VRSVPVSLPGDRPAFRAVFRLLFQGALCACGAIAFAAIIVSFAMPALAAVFSPLFAMDGVATETATGIGASRVALALRFTLLEAFLSALVAILLGLPAAALVARRDFPGRRVLLSLSGVPLCVPPVIIALAFVLFYGRQGYLNRALMSAFDLSEPPVTFLYSIAGVVIAHGFYNFPVVLRTVCVAWERLDERELEAASLLGAGRLRAWRTITFPKLSGAVLSSAALVFLYCFFSFVIVLLFGGVGGTTLEVELYQAARTSLDFRAAGTIALVETAAAAVVFLYSRALRASARASGGSGGSGGARPRKPLSGPIERVLASAYLAFIAFFFVGPLASIVVRSLAVPAASAFSSSASFGLGAWASFLGRQNFLPALVRTVAVSLSSATLATAGALFFALALDRAKGRLARLVRDAVPLLPLAVSSVALGFGWSLVSPRGNVAILVLAESAIAWPFAWTQIRASLDRIPASARDAAAILSRSGLDARFRVFVPLVRKGILSGAGFVFAIAAGDATLPLVLSIRGFENLPLLLFRLSGSYRFSEACACATFLALLSGFAFFLQDAADRGEGDDR
jgi:thiamine transport system permease protein